MKTLLVFRHGKSDWKADFDHDHERPIKKRGRKAAALMGRLLAEAGEAPDGIVTSSAVRARQTLDQAVEAGGWTAPVRVTRALYEADPARVLAEVRAEPDSTTTLLLVGHEPTWSELVSDLIGGGTVRFPTAAVARIDLDVETWAEARFGQGELVWFLIPRFFDG